MTTSTSPVRPTTATSGHRSAVPTRTVGAHKGQNHTVKYGESLFSLAPSSIMATARSTRRSTRSTAEPVTNPDYIAPGTVLFIPDLGIKEALTIPNEP